MNIEATNLGIHAGYKVGDSLSDALQLTTNNNFFLSFFFP